MILTSMQIAFMDYKFSSCMLNCSSLISNPNILTQNLIAFMDHKFSSCVLNCSSLISNPNILTLTMIAFMDHKFSSCVLNWSHWPWYLGKSQGLAKAKADYLFFGCFGGP